jgi:branched-chain amino acid transport system substrate-binding protein
MTQVIILASIIGVAAIIGGVYLYYSLHTSEKTPIKIGFNAPMTGGSAYWGLSMKAGAQVALDELGEAGLLGRKVEIIFEDDQGKTEVGVSVFEKFILQDHVDFIVGGVQSSVALATMDVAAKYGILNIMVIPASDEITDKIGTDPAKYKYVFRVNMNSSAFSLDEIQCLTDLIQTGKFKNRNNKMAILVEDSDWGREVGEKWKDYWTSKGWEVVLFETFKTETTDFYPVLTKIKNLDPCVLKTETTSVPPGAALTKQIYELGLSSRLLHIDSSFAHVPSESEWVGMVGVEATEYILAKYTPPTPSWFMQKCLEKYDKCQEQYAMKAYDAMKILFAAVEKAGSIEPSKVAQALETETFIGLWGKYKFTSNHGTLSGAEWIAMHEFQMRDGKWYRIWPFPGEKEFAAPPESVSG